MQIQVLIPSQNQRMILVEVFKEETVNSFRKIVANELKIAESDFLLIAFGKILMDRKSNNELATLFSTYRIRHQTCIFVHINTLMNESYRTEIVAKHRETVVKRKPIRDRNLVSTPFGDFTCNECQNDNKLKKCLECGCAKCHYKTGDPLICDQCDNYWHLECANLQRVPKAKYWYCPECINLDGDLIVGRNERISEGKSRKKLIVIRDTECVLVPPQHVGKIPGIYCGQSWALRSLMHDWGVHRTPLSAVAGSSYTGAVSLVLSGGLKEDRDEGYQFVFSGSGGNLKSRNKVNTEQMTGDQQLTLTNKALAITCYAALNTEIGAKAIHWRKSRPIRVCRASNRLSTHPEFAPLEGIRYDGLYKVVKYWPHRDSKSGFIIWKFLLRRDDQEAPPWMSLCKQLVTKRGIRMIHRENSGMTKKLVRYTISRHIQRLIPTDTENKRMWNEIREMEFWSEYEFLHHLFDNAVACSSNACPKPIKDPVTMSCGHIICVKCLSQSKANKCFTCRRSLPEKFEINLQLVRILQSLNWAYGIELSEPLPTSFIKDDEAIIKEEDSDFTIKQEFEFPTLSEALNAPDINTNFTSKRVKIFIENLGNESAGQNKKQKK